jgi:hypothetical protein
MIIEIEIGGEIRQMDTKSVKVILPEGRYQREIEIDEKEITVTITDDDGEVFDCASVEHGTMFAGRLVVVPAEDAPDEDR